MRDIILIWASISFVCILGAAAIGYRIRKNREAYTVHIDEAALEGDLLNEVRDINFGARS